MKRFCFLLCCFLLSVSSNFSQNCSGLVEICKNNLTLGNPKFLSDGQVYSVFLDREKSEFKTTFFGKSTYRISVSAGNSDNYVIFTVKDLSGNVIFSNKNYDNAPYWDFVVPETLPVLIETELDINKKNAGCVVMLIGFIQ